MADRTPNYNLELIDFNKIPWHTNEHDNWRSIDAIFANFILINQMQGVWQNAIVITVGQRYVDPEGGTIWTALVAHTTTSIGLFAATRIDNPTYWELFSDVALAESWASSLAGLVNSVDYSSKAYAVGTVTQLPNGSAKRWAVEIENTEVISGSYSALHHATKAAASAVLTAADLAATNQDTIDTAADLVETAADVVLTNADVVLTHADVVLTHADEVLTRADTVATAADVVTAGNSATTATAAAQGWGAVTTITAANTSIEHAAGRTYYIIDATSNSVTITLPAIGTTEGTLFGFQVSNVNNAITIARDGDTINGASAHYTGLTAVGQVIHFIADDNPDNWLATIISQNATATATSEGVIELATDAETLTGTATNRAVTPANAKATYSGIIRTINAQTGSGNSAYALAAVDAGAIVTANNSSAGIITIPPNSSVPFAIGTQVDIYNLGAGIFSIKGGSGVTLNGVSTGAGAMNAQFSAITCFKIATDTWLMTGAHEVVA